MAWCRKCAFDQPHPFAHWHVRCPLCQQWKIFRGASCRKCHRAAREIAEDLFR